MLLSSIANKGYRVMKRRQDKRRKKKHHDEETTIVLARTEEEEEGSSPESSQQLFRENKSSSPVTTLDQVMTSDDEEKNDNDIFLNDSYEDSQDEHSESSSPLKIQHVSTRSPETQTSPLNDNDDPNSSFWSDAGEDENEEVEPRGLLDQFDLHEYNKRTSVIPTLPQSSKPQTVLLHSQPVCEKDTTESVPSAESATISSNEIIKNKKESPKKEEKPPLRDMKTLQKENAPSGNVTNKLQPENESKPPPLPQKTVRSAVADSEKKNSKSHHLLTGCWDDDFGIVLPSVSTERRATAEAAQTRAKLRLEDAEDSMERNIKQAQKSLDDARHLLTQAAQAYAQQSQEESEARVIYDERNEESQDDFVKTHLVQYYNHVVERLEQARLEKESCHTALAHARVSYERVIRKVLHAVDVAREEKKQADAELDEALRMERQASSAYEKSMHTAQELKENNQKAGPVAKTTLEKTKESLTTEATIKAEELPEKSRMAEPPTVQEPVLVETQSQERKSLAKRGAPSSESVPINAPETVLEQLPRKDPTEKCLGQLHNRVATEEGPSKECESSNWQTERNQARCDANTEADNDESTYANQLLAELEEIPANLEAKKGGNECSFDSDSSVEEEHPHRMFGAFDAKQYQEQMLNSAGTDVDSEDEAYWVSPTSSGSDDDGWKSPEEKKEESELVKMFENDQLLHMPMEEAQEYLKKMAQAVVTKKQHSHQKETPPPQDNETTATVVTDDDDSTTYSEEKKDEDELSRVLKEHDDQLLPTLSSQREESASATVAKEKKLAKVFENDGLLDMSPEEVCLYLKKMEQTVKNSTTNEHVASLPQKSEEENSEESSDDVKESCPKDPQHFDSTLDEGGNSSCGPTRVAADPADYLIKSFEGHVCRVCSVAPFGKDRFISGSEKGSIRLFDVSSGECIGVFHGHTDSVYSLVQLDSERFLSASDDETVKLWHVGEKECLHTFLGHKDRVACVASFANDAFDTILLRQDRFLTGSDDRTIRLWSIAKQKCIKSYNGYGRIHSLAVLSNGRFVSGADDGMIRLWVLSMGKPVRSFEHKSVLSFAVLDGNRFISSSLDKSIKVWDSSVKGECTSLLEGHESGVWSVSKFDNDNRVVSGSSDGTVKVWDLDSQICTRTIETSVGVVTAVATMGNAIISSGALDGSVSMWSSK